MERARRVVDEQLARLAAITVGIGRQRRLRCHVKRLVWKLAHHNELGRQDAAVDLAQQGEHFWVDGG